MGKTLVKVPQRVEVIPAVIPHKALQLDAALAHQLSTNMVDRLDALGLGHAVLYLPADVQVIPRIVVQVLSVGLGPLPLQVVEKCAAQLSFRHHTNDR